MRRTACVRPIGVLADDRHGRLWVCSVPNSFGPRLARARRQPSEVVAFDLKTGKLIGRWPFPAPGGTCNDIAIGPDGAAYATDTPGGRILKLPRGGNALEVVVERRSLEGHRRHRLRRRRQDVHQQRAEAGAVARDAAVRRHAGGAEIARTSDRKMEGPDGLRPIGGNRFLQAEGTSGRITLLTIDGDNAHIVVLREGLQSSPGVTLIGNTVYAVEGKINYLSTRSCAARIPARSRPSPLHLPR